MDSVGDVVVVVVGDELARAVPTDRGRRTFDEVEASAVRLLRWVGPDFGGAPRGSVATLVKVAACESSFYQVSSVHQDQSADDECDEDCEADLYDCDDVRLN